MKKRVAIHQPNFFPWLGFFKKWAESDVFVLLDDVQVPLKGGSWTNRTHIVQAGEKKWLTAPIERETLANQKLSDVLLVSGSAWKRRASGQIQHSYSRCNYGQDAIVLFNTNLETDNRNLLHVNLHSLRQIGGLLGLSWSQIVMSSSLETKSSGTQRLVDIVKAVGGDTYLSGDGAQGYQRDDAFPKAGVKLEFLEFTQPKYSQRGADNFIPGLSVLDSLANLGAKETRSLLSSGGNQNGS